MYKFKSKAAADVIMMGPPGDQVLKLLGREPSAPGIIEPQDMPMVIARLEQAVQDEEAARQRAEAEAAEEGRQLPPFEGVSLRQRVWPLIESLKRSHGAQVPVVWGV